MPLSKGAATIAEKWRDAVARRGSYWTVDQVIVDPYTDRAVIEWSYFKKKKPSSFFLACQGRPKAHFWRRIRANGHWRAGAPTKKQIPGRRRSVAPGSGSWRPLRSCPVRAFEGEQPKFCL